MKAADANAGNTPTLTNQQYFEERKLLLEARVAHTMRFGIPGEPQLLRHYPAYVAWRKAPSQKQNSAPTRSDDAVETPEEALDHAAAQLRQSLEADLLDRVRAAPSAFLERVVVDLLIAMGYGGGDTARGRVTGQAGGAIDAANTTKGVFVTTAGFTRSATDYVAKSPKRIVLIAEPARESIPACAGKPVAITICTPSSRVYPRFYETRRKSLVMRRLPPGHGFLTTFRPTSRLR